MRVVGKNNCKYLSPLGFGDKNIEPVQGLSRKIIISEKLNTGRERILVLHGTNSLQV